MPIVLLSLIPAPLRAQQVRLSSPLDGYVRPGRAVAVTVAADGLPGSELMLSADGAVPVRLPVTAGRVAATVPLLPTGDATPAEVRWASGSAAGTAPLPDARRLTVNDRLVLTAGDPPGAKAVAAALFPGRRVILVRAGGAGGSGTSAAAGTAAAWPVGPSQVLAATDAVLLDAPAAARADEADLRVMLAGGTTVAVRSPARPAGRWPWRAMPDFDGSGANAATPSPADVAPAGDAPATWWVLRHDVAGPGGGGPAGENLLAGPAADAYLPTYAWDRSRPPAVRRAALWAAAVGGLALVAASLWGGRRGLLASLGVCGAGAAAAAAYARSLPLTVAAAGEVVVVAPAAVGAGRGEAGAGGRPAQRDRWTYVSALRPARAAVPAGDLTWPVPAGGRQLASLDLSLVCGPDGAPIRFEFALPGKQTVAFLTRSTEPAADPPAGPGAGDPAGPGLPIGLVADRLYPGTLADRSARPPPDAPAGDWWGTAVMRR